MSIKAAYMLPHPPIIVPEIGRGEEQKIVSTMNAYHETARRIALEKPQTIVLITPHQVMYADYFHISPGKSAKGDLGKFGAPQVHMEVQYDTAFTERLCLLAAVKQIPAGMEGERNKSLDHGTMVPLYFVNQYWQAYKLVRIGLSGLPLTMHYALGECIQEAADALGRNVIVIASGDLSHRLKEDGPYGYQEEGPAYDHRIMDVMARGAFRELFEFPESFCEKALECGHRSFTMMAGALDKTGTTAEKLSYEGTFGVGYGICCYQAGANASERNFREQYEEQERKRLAIQRENEDAYVRLARQTIETYIRTGDRIKVPEGLPVEMNARAAGVFVSVKENGALRGCIGTIQATSPCIAEEIIQNAISAATKDPRFMPIMEEELDKLVISVDVLGETERIESPDELDVRRFGVIVTKGHKRGLLLPNLDGIDTVEEQIAIAKNKAGIGKDQEVGLERFEVIRHF